MPDHKRLIADYLGCFGKSDIAGLLGMMAEDATWWVNTRPGLHPGAGTRTKAEMAEVWAGLYDVLDGGLTLEPLTLVAEGDRVVAEVRSHAVTRSGKVYDNGYLFLFTVRDGRIASVREYTDLLFAVATFGAG